MNSLPIIDAHAHFGAEGRLFAPVWTFRDLLGRMDQLGIGYAIAPGHCLSVAEGSAGHMQTLRDGFDESGGRIYYLGPFNPKRSDACLAAIDDARGWPGFAGIKIAPSRHGAGDDPAYEPIWGFAAEHGLPILTHSWSVSPYNPAQALATPERFEEYVRRFPEVRLVLAHAGGPRSGRYEAIRMANEYPNVYMDFSGDVFNFELIE